MSSKPNPVDIETLLGEARWVRGLASSLVKDPAAADDLVQETWLASLQHPPRTGGSVRGWLGRVLGNAAAARHRAELRRRQREWRASRPEAQDPTREALARASLQSLLVSEIQNLEEIYRTVLILRYYENLPPRKVAERLGLSGEVVRKRIQRGLAKLRQRLEGEYGSGWENACIGLFQLASTGLGGASLLAGATFMTTQAKLVGLISLILIAGVMLWQTELGRDETRESATHDAALGLEALDENTAARSVAAESDPRRAVLERPTETEEDSPASFFGWYGRVVDPEGQPIANARVRTSQDRFAETHTNAAGEFRLPWDPQVRWNPGDSLYATARGYAPSDKQVLWPEQPAQLLELELRTGIDVVVVALREQDRAPVPNVPVLFMRGDRGAEDEAVTDEQGRARFVTPAPGMHLVRPKESAPIRIKPWTERLVTQAGPNELWLPVQPYPSRLSLVARDARSGATLEQARFWRAVPGSYALGEQSSRPADWRTLSSTAGFATIEVAAKEQPVFVAVEAPGYFPQSFFPAEESVEPLELALRPLREVAVEVVSRGQALTTSATVRWSYSLPLEVVPELNRQDSVLFQWAAPKRRQTEERVTDARGKASLPLPIPTGASRQFVDFEIEGQGGLQRRIERLDMNAIGEPPLRFELQPAWTTLRFLVEDERGRPLQGARINGYLRSVEGDPFAIHLGEERYTDGLTDEQGQVEFRRPGRFHYTWSLTYGEERLNDHQGRTLPESALGGVHVQRIVVDSAGSQIRGRVIPWGGARGEVALGEISIEAVSIEDGETVRRTDTEQDGSFRFRDLEPGSYGLSLYDFESVPAVQAKAGDREVELPLPPLRTLKIDVRKSLGGGIVPRCSLRVFYGEVDWYDYYTRNEGVILVPNLGPEVHAVMVHRSDYAPVAFSLRNAPPQGLVPLTAHLESARSVEIRFLDEAHAFEGKLGGFLWHALPGEPPLPIYGTSVEGVHWENAPQTPTTIQAMDWDGMPIGIPFELPAGSEAGEFVVDPLTGTLR